MIEENWQKDLKRSKIECVTSSEQTRTMLTLTRKNVIVKKTKCYNLISAFRMWSLDNGHTEKQRRTGKRERERERKKRTNE